MRLKASYREMLEIWLDTERAYGPYAADVEVLWTKRYFYSLDRIRYPKKMVGMQLMVDLYGGKAG